MKRKNNYEQPETVVTRVELESPICSGSVSMEAQAPEGINTQAQEVNTDFGYDNDYSRPDASGWETN